MGAASDPDALYRRASSRIRFFVAAQLQIGHSARSCPARRAVFPAEDR